MGDCCVPRGYDEMFSQRFARRTAARYRRRGLGRAAGAIVSFLTERGIDGATVLEVGGGVGYLHIELLRRGAAKATNLEIATNYEPEAARLLEHFGLADRVERRILDIAQTPEAVDPADVVVMHQVVCCYPDYERLLAAAAGKAGRYLVFSHPPRSSVSRALVQLDNVPRILRREAFRGFAHPPAAMVDVAVAGGLRQTYGWRGLVWRVVGLER
jgi:cyclopropane fatty-acyl-phospholipid synthase-like methyltransferase